MTTPSLQRPVLAVAHRDVPLLRLGDTIGAALERIRAHGVGERIVYFYALDGEDRLAGVVPARRLLTAPLDQPVAEAMIAPVVTLGQDATVLDACEVFHARRLLALPVVDTERRVVGVVDVTILADELEGLLEAREDDDVFERIGFRVAEVRGASIVTVFRARFQWLLATLGGGVAGAVLASAFGATLAQSLVLAFFLPLLLGLAESVAVQSMSVALRALHVVSPTVSWLVRRVRSELLVGVSLGLALGALTAAIAQVWRGASAEAVVLGGGVALSVSVAAVVGVAVPFAVHALRLDPKVASGPLALALTDLCTLATVFGLGAALLGA